MSRIFTLISFLYFNVAVAGIYKFPLSSGAIIVIKTPYMVGLNQAVTRYENAALFNFEVKLELYFSEYTQGYHYQSEWAPEILLEVDQVVTHSNVDIEKFSITDIEYSSYTAQMPYMYPFYALPGTYIEYIQPPPYSSQDVTLFDAKPRMDGACGSSGLADADSIFISSPGKNGLLCDKSFINALPKTEKPMRCGFILSNSNGKSKNIYPCRMSCGKVFFNSEYRSQHHKTHLTSEQLESHERGENITCSGCGKEFSLLRHLMKHLFTSRGCSN